MNDKPLIDILVNLSCSRTEYAYYYKDTYLSGKTRNTRNIVAEHIDKVYSLVKEMKLKVEKCIKCNVVVKRDTMVIGVIYLEKAECFKNISCTGTNLQTLLTDKTFPKTFKKRLGERNEKAIKANTTTECSTIC